MGGYAGPLTIRFIGFAVGSSRSGPGLRILHGMFSASEHDISKEVDYDREQRSRTEWSDPLW